MVVEVFVHQWGVCGLLSLVRHSLLPHKAGYSVSGGHPRLLWVHVIDVVCVLLSRGLSERFHPSSLSGASTARSRWTEMAEDRGVGAQSYLTKATSLRHSYQHVVMILPGLVAWLLESFNLRPDDMLNPER